MSETPLSTMLVGESVPMRRLRERIVQVARSPLPILIAGPTGVGKELVAQALHQDGRRPGRFVALNVAAIAGSMFEDAMFGHVRGAFTGAVAAHVGYVCDAHRGTLFLDEVGTLGLTEQAKLLRVLEMKSVRPIGAACDVPSDFRLVSATNASLETLAHEGQFRADLLYRVRGATITVPTLRERLDDIPLLCTHFVRHACAQIGGSVRMLPSAIRELQEHDWPGNVRELKTVVERLVYESTDEYVTALAVGNILSEHRDEVCVVRADVDTRREDLLAMLERHTWNTHHAAREWGISRATIYRLMRQLDVRRPIVNDRQPRAITSNDESVS